MPRRRPAPFSLLPLTLVGCLLGCGAVDLRPDDRTALTAPDSEAKGRALLEEAASASGEAAWRSHELSEVLMTDVWDLPLGAEHAMMPWDGERLAFRYAHGAYDGHFVYLEGDQKGETIGLQAGATYRRAPGGEPVFEDDFMTAFFVGAFAYLNELPFRIGRATVVRALDDGTFQGKRYHRVFASWNTDEVQDDVDQYVVWIDPDTSRVRLVEYTLRDFSGLMRGTCAYDDYREVDGVQLPFKLTVTQEPDDDYLDGFLHQVTVSAWTFDSFDRALVYPDAARGSLGAGAKVAAP